MLLVMRRQKLAALGCECAQARSILSTALRWCLWCTPFWQEAREFCKEIRLYGGLRSVVSRSQVRASFRAIARLSALSISFHRRKSIGKDRECFALDFLHPLRPAGPTLLNHILTTADAACRPETQWKPRPAIRLVGRKPEGNA
jgi:hypothetical protein